MKQEKRQLTTIQFVKRIQSAYKATLNTSYVTEYFCMYCQVVPFNCTKTPLSLGACWVMSSPD